MQPLGQHLPHVQRPCHSSFNPVKGKSREGDTKITDLSEREGIYSQKALTNAAIFIAAQWA